MNDIRPCPFCYGSGRLVDDDFGALGVIFAVHCDACGTTGPVRKKPALAIRMWNRRALSVHFDDFSIPVSGATAPHTTEEAHNA